MEKTLTQVESKFVSDFLRERHSIKVKNGLVFFRLSPSKASEFILTTWGKHIHPLDIERAARREAEK